MLIDRNAEKQSWRKLESDTVYDFLSSQQQQQLFESLNCRLILTYSNFMHYRSKHYST